MEVTVVDLRGPEKVRGLRLNLEYCTHLREPLMPHQHVLLLGRAYCVLYLSQQQLVPGFELCHRTKC